MRLRISFILHSTHKVLLVFTYIGVNVSIFYFVTVLRHNLNHFRHDTSKVRKKFVAVSFLRSINVLMKLQVQ